MSLHPDEEKLTGKLGGETARRVVLRCKNGLSHPFSTDVDTDCACLQPEELGDGNVRFAVVEMKATIDSEKRRSRSNSPLPT